MKDINIYRDDDDKINGIGFSQTLLDSKKSLPLQIYLNEREIYSNLIDKIVEFHKSRSIPLACEIADDLYKLYN